ncbi:hypothetical protein AWB77_02278 [Caballeronia fortuita]|uniref:Uncharacterized protein n=1 Tax=Caballeronia fortuita TaxID=1777138 RepID=A0A158B0A1_9BURK|nr:hypothetical protein [Caballeronia fortuita]SAK63502.1 hypothetical protein AWB77_02278 [Caballeronia fortuita]
MNKIRPVISQSRHLRDLDKSAQDFLHAVDLMNETSRELPPVRAAGAGLVPAWRAWVQALEHRDGAQHDELHLSGRADFQTQSAGNAAFRLTIEALRVHHPAMLDALSGNDLKRRATLTQCAALYQVRPHAVIEPTDALQTWLAHTDIGNDVPASLVRLPFPAVFIRFGPEMARAVDASLWADISHPIQTRGVYVFETVRHDRRELYFLVVGVPPGHVEEQPRGLQIAFTDEGESVSAQVLDLEDRSGFVDSSCLGMVQMCLKVLLYMQTVGAVRIDDLRHHEIAARLGRVGGKKASKLERRLASRYNRIIVGPSHIIHHSPSEVSPHWRRGHMRMQAHGPQFSLRKLMFIAPTLIRADRLNEAGATVQRAQ